MNKKYVLTNNLKFNEVIKVGKKVKNDSFVVYFLPNFELKIGITIGTKLGKAHFRNYHKRVIRAICRTNIEKFPKGYFVIIGRQALKNNTYQEKEKKLLKLIEGMENVK